MAEKSSLETIWGQRMAGIAVKDVDVTRPASHQDVQYLINQRPFLQMINSMALFDSDAETTFITAQSGWTIHDYGDALSSSAGEYLYGGGDATKFLKSITNTEEDDEGGEEGGAIALPGKGTIIKQAVDTAMEMIAMALQKEWPGVQLVDGTELMKWAAWIAAQEQKLALEGYEPDEEAEKKRDRIRHLIGEEAVAPKLEI